MVLCTRKGCGKEFDEATSSNNSDCNFHPGVPVFHEGLKSWSCCSETNKPVTSFDEFLSLKGCTTGSHSSERPVEPPKPLPSSSSSTPTPTSTDKDGREVYGSSVASPIPPRPSAPTNGNGAAAPPIKPVSTPYVEEQDDPSLPCAVGAMCKRKACGKSWDGNSREGEQCVYHPGVPIFHEASKGWSCCKPRHLDFDEFLKIPGCRRGRHLFVGSTTSQQQEEIIECRVDHYQTPMQVHVSVFGKGADKELSKVIFEKEAMHVELHLPSSKRFQKSFPLFGPIDPTTSTFKILGTKCEIVLAKADARSWPSITALDPELSKNFTASLIFSAGGGRGTTGAKSAVLDDLNKARQSPQPPQ
ncbi:chord-domain-containing protein [Meredithblackwellia eburnea MCA 4105]